MVGNMKPCPRCGGVPELHQGHADITYVLCHDCGAVTSFRPNLKGRATVEAWNRRPPPPKVNSDMHMASSVRDCLAASAQETGVRPDDGMCRAGTDGECTWKDCPQNRDGEPLKSGRDCPRQWSER
jgi:hypothetical protein